MNACVYWREVNGGCRVASSPITSGRLRRRCLNIANLDLALISLLHYSHIINKASFDQLCINLWYYRSRRDEGNYRSRSNWRRRWLCRGIGVATWCGQAGSVELTHWEGVRTSQSCRHYNIYLVNDDGKREVLSI